MSLALLVLPDQLLLDAVGPKSALARNHLLFEAAPAPAPTTPAQQDPKKRPAAVNPPAAAAAHPPAAPAATQPTADGQQGTTAQPSSPNFYQRVVGGVKGGMKGAWTGAKQGAASGAIGGAAIGGVAGGGLPGAAAGGLAGGAAGGLGGALIGGVKGAIQGVKTPGAMQNTQQGQDPQDPQAQEPEQHDHSDVKTASRGAINVTSHKDEPPKNPEPVKPNDPTHLKHFGGDRQKAHQFSQMGGLTTPDGRLLVPTIHLHHATALMHAPSAPSAALASFMPGAHPAQQSAQPAQAAGKVDTASLFGGAGKQPDQQPAQPDPAQATAATPTAAEAPAALAPSPKIIARPKTSTAISKTQQTGRLEALRKEVAARMAASSAKKPVKEKLKAEKPKTPKPPASGPLTIEPSEGTFGGRTQKDSEKTKEKPPAKAPEDDKNDDVAGLLPKSRDATERAKTLKAAAAAADKKAPASVKDAEDDEDIASSPSNGKETARVKTPSTIFRPTQQKVVDNSKEDAASKATPQWEKNNIRASQRAKRSPEEAKASLERERKDREHAKRLGIAGGRPTRTERLMGWDRTEKHTPKDVEALDSKPESKVDRTDDATTKDSATKERQKTEKSDDSFADRVSDPDTTDKTPERSRTVGTEGEKQANAASTSIVEQPRTLAAVGESAHARGKRHIKAVPKDHSGYDIAQDIPRKTLSRWAKEAHKESGDDDKKAQAFIHNKLENYSNKVTGTRIRAWQKAGRPGSIRAWLRSAGHQGGVRSQQASQHAPRKEKGQPEGERQSQTSSYNPPLADLLREWV